MENLTIIKIGTNVIIDNNQAVRKDLLEEFFGTILSRTKMGEKFIVIASGSVALGRKETNNPGLEKALAAGIGQPILMQYFREAGKKYNFQIAELLLSRPHLVKRREFLSLQTKIENFLTHPDFILVVNENDFLVNGTDWGFGDNDSLAGALAVALSAKKLLIVSSIDGLYQDGKVGDKKSLLNEIEDVNAELMKFCRSDISTHGTGGMISKLKVARLCRAVCIETQIISGLKFGNLELALAGNKIGTKFLTHKSCQVLKNRDRWILSAKTSAASIMVDNGAVLALQKGTSLLAVGIKNIFGSFENGDLVELLNENKESIAIGVVDLSSVELQKNDFKKQRGVQVMHADNIMVLSPNPESPKG